MCQMTESALLHCGKDGTATTKRNIALCSWKPSNLSCNSFLGLLPEFLCVPPTPKMI
jgi:hypothetical protein